MNDSSPTFEDITTVSTVFNTPMGVALLFGFALAIFVSICFLRRRKKP